MHSRLRPLILSSVALVSGLLAIHSASAASDFAIPIERAHQAAEWRSKPAVQAEITIRFGGKTRFAGKLLMEPHGGIVRMERADGAVAVFDGKEAWVSKNADWPKARFDVLTWAYFLAAPYKLNDAGARLEPTGKGTLEGQEFDTAKLTFAAGTGDASGDWYVLYRDPESGRLAAMAYVVTFGQDEASGSEEPHAILFGDFKDVDGVPIPMHWTFRNWSKTEGVTGDPIGEVTLENVTFPKPSAEAFSRPTDAVSAPIPKK